MNTTSLRRKRVLLPAIAVVAVLGAGGTAWAATADDTVDGSERDRVAAAATDAVGGEAVEVEASDDQGEAYEVEVRLPDGTEVDVALAEDLAVVAEERDGTEDDAETDATPDPTVTETQREAAGAAAVDAVGGGEALEVEASDDGSQAYEVEVRDADGAVWDVDLDADYGVVDKKLDD